MGIYKRAKNMYVKINKTSTIIAKTYSVTAEKITITATEGNLNLVSNKKVILTGKEGVVFGDYVASIEKKHPEIIEIQFINDKNTVLKQSLIKNFGGIKGTDILYGKKVKIKIITKEVEDGTKISFNLQGKTKSMNQVFFGLDKLKWNLEIKDNICETDFFELKPLWYSEDLEKYNDKTHKTEIKTEDLNNFYVKGVLRAIPFELPEKKDWLAPIAYLRNYEESIGLFNTNDLEIKDLQSNYENHFISSNLEILKIERDFSEFINNTKDLTIEQIKTRVEHDAKCIWDMSMKQVQSGKLDDRPLYWARNKMQVQIKRHFLFEEDIDFEKSIVKKGTELDKIIQVFEGKSRNYAGIDFSKGGSKKKVLITGFDPFQLEFGKDTFNPSGIVALNSQNNLKLLDANIFVQTCIFPVRYEDFDNGIVEKIVAKFIDEVDMIITTSLNGSNSIFDIEKYAIEFRGGGTDNMNIGEGGDEERLIRNINSIYTETTLPKDKIFEEKNIITINNLSVRYDIEKDKENGSGGNYLSNEIMYRATKVRGSKSKKPVGHFHLGNLKTHNKSDINRMNEVIDVVNEIIIKILK
ncbi:C15 family peptidase [Flavobacterium hercynium]|uniref:Uncharacterized protein n=1 Tax=Flavobacterium hercynium TaxID=387094 RepID=A0A226HIL0_9FLAO|nr:hypothetical protein [Flavobacterium hercynium]OXA93481.1 hypothetical protein B0A66_06530 [Flavobacterium hercynium]SMP31909.1 Pyrrolidone-carboxylate peptidase (N-terminal pyroglutamyl peptidase) [Flavobacterium hercynium]